MKSRDTVILNKILEYCRQVDEACEMFGNDFLLFREKSVFQNACCMCILQIGELCKVVSDNLKEEEPQIAWNTIQDDLSKLKVECERILNKN